MKITTNMVKRILDNAQIEYRGCHNPDPKNPLYGRNAYFMVDNTKISFPVSTMNPRAKTLRTLLEKELKRRLEFITLSIDVSWSGYMQIVQVDPYSVVSLVKKYVDKQYIDINYKEKNNAQLAN